MYLRDTDFPTLAETADQIASRTLKTWSGSSTDVKPHIEWGEGETTEDVTRAVTGTITLGTKEVPVTRGGLQVLAGFYDVPYKFLDRIPVDEQQFILDHRIQRSEDRPLVLRYDDTGVHEAYLANQVRVDPRDIVEGLIDPDKYFPEDAKVTDFWSTTEEFRLDVIVPEGYSRGIGGDKKVGDITHGGIRIGQNRKQNLVPWVQPFLFRLVCTNGMEIPDLGMKIEGRGVTDPADIVAGVLREAGVAMRRVERDIEHFYSLREEKVGNDPTGVLHRMSRELGIPMRTIGRLNDTLADALMAEDEVTMFHLVNHITNRANDPEMADSARRRLQQAGGQTISEHAARCERCHSRLN